MYFWRHPNPSDAPLEKANRSHEKIWNVVDAQRTFTVHFQHLDMLRRGSMPHMKAQSNQVLIRQRFVPVASAFEFTDDAQAKNADMFLGARFSGLCFFRCLLVQNFDKLIADRLSPGLLTFPLYSV